MKPPQYWPLFISSGIVIFSIWQHQTLAQQNDMSPAEFQQGLVKFYPELYKLVGYPNLEQTEFALQKHCWNHAMSTTAHLFTKGASKEQMLSLWKKKDIGGWIRILL